ncbi:Endonuclease, Uma2 family (restriction endonuclease fold) [Thermoflexibacter ruber]|uniref:Endonuclease, Uma2 family (Restriction endonuclease fold) n=2 Tax=Thermoflexibacter ruber TaxID=1003 RepID=A0A1I2HZG5_9BACT|nr:Endonuclease, Uma2 family (restriction endonuclease fold) [Thermoflexibacter ruber]
MGKTKKAMVTSLSELDFSKQYNYADYLTWQLGERIELIKGYIKKMAAPTPFHQEISGEFFNYFKNYFKSTKRQCKVFTAPFDVRLYNYSKSAITDKDIYTVVQPDLSIICDKSKIDSKGCLGAPDLIIEILSESNSKTDLRDKFQLYQENAVQEYWIVFPAEKAVQKFLLTDDKYQLEKIYVEDDLMSPTLFPDLVIDLVQVFEEI